MIKQFSPARWHSPPASVGTRKLYYAREIWPAALFVVVVVVVAATVMLPLAAVVVVVV